LAELAEGTSEATSCEPGRCSAYEELVDRLSAPSCTHYGTDSCHLPVTFTCILTTEACVHGE